MAATSAPAVRKLRTAGAKKGVKCARRPENQDGGNTLSRRQGESLLSGRILELYDDDTIGSVVFLQARFVLQHGNAFDLLRVQRLED